MKKKIFTLLLAVAASIGTMFAQRVQVGDLYYNLYENYVAHVTDNGVTYADGNTLKYNKGRNITTISIPSTFEYLGETYTVKGIDNFAFADCGSLASVTIPNTVTKIASYAFRSCTALTSVNMPNSLTIIGEGAFQYCSSLHSVTISNNVTSIGMVAFSGCESIASIIIPNSVTSIGQGAFIDCTALTSIVLSNSITSIEPTTFSGCAALTSITIPNNVTSIGATAFLKCTALTSITIPSSVSSIASNSFMMCPKLKNINFEGSAEDWCQKAWSPSLICANYNLSINGSVIGNFVVPNTVTSIPNNLFNGCKGLNSVTIPNSVTNIGESAFYDCTSLSSVTIPNSITSIGKYAFYGCTGLTSLTIPGSVESIGTAAFYLVLNIYYNGSDPLSPWGAKYLNKYADGYFLYEDASKTVLLGCSSAAQGEITIPNSVTTINQYAFQNCHDLTTVIVPNSVTTIGKGAFSGVLNVLYNGTATGSPWGAEAINGYIDGYFLYSDASKTTLLKCSSSAEGVVSIPNSVTRIRGRAFADCSGLTSVTIGNSVTSIEYSTFYECSGLTSVTIGNSVTSIGSYAFHNCSNLSSITIPNSVTSIGDYAFQACSKLNSIEIPNSVTSIGEGAFYSCSGLISVTVGSGVQNIGKHAFLYCAALDSIFWNAVDCNLYSDYTNPTVVPNNTPFYTRGSSSGYEPNTVSAISFGESVVHIPNHLCAYMRNLKSIYNYSPIPQVVSSAALNTHISPQYITLYVSYASEALYREADVWKNFWEIQGTDFGEMYTVTFVDWDNTELKSVQVYRGHSATAPANPTREGYTFTGWDKDFSNVQSNLTVIAQYTQNAPSTTYYTVTFKDWNGAVLSTQQVEEGHAATAPENPTREGYTFTGWDKDFSNVQSDLIVTAQYTQNTPSTTYYTVTFKDWDGTVLKTQQVEKGHAATAPTNPTREGYTFIGWDKDFTNVQSNLIVTAKYQKNGSASSFVGFESTNSHSLATQIYSEGLVQNISNVALVETDAASHKYSINLVNGGEGTFSMGGVVFSYTNAEAGKTAYKTYVQYIQPNGSDREIRIPTEKGQQVKVVLVEACAGILVDGVSKDFVAGENVLTSQNGTIVLKNGSAKPKISAILPLNSVGSTDAITVRLKASSAAGWSKVNLYYWGEGVTSPAWPGVTIKEDAEGWYSYTFASVTSVNIIWNDGNNQTQEISNVTESTCYSLKSTSGKTIGVNVVECEAAASVSVTGVSLNKKTLQMVVGNTATLTASVLPANASNKSVTWTSSNTATATVSSTGTISAKAEGVTTITCKTVDGNFTAECYVVVSAANSEYTFSYEPTNATVINYTATELSYTEIPENNCVFAALADNAHTLNLMYVGSLVNGVIPQGNYKITSTLQNGTFCYSVGGDDQYDYGSYLATDYDSEGYYTSSYYIIAGDIIIGSNNNYTVKVVSANGTDINVTYAYAGTVDVEIVPSEIKAFKILRDGQIFILRGEKVYTLTGQEVR